MIHEFKSWHAGALFLGFFAVVIGVNVMLGVYAISTFSGEDLPDPYLSGLAYNKTLEARAAQAARGWKVEISTTRDAGRRTTVTLRLVDASGQALNTLDVEATLRRPTNAALDRVVKLSPSGDGVYRATLGAVASGQWDVMVRARSGQGVVLEAQRRVVLR